MNVLIVDDEPLAIESLKINVGKALIKEETQIRSYSNPIEAFEGMADFVPDIAFLDIEMPGINGVEMAVRLKHMFRNVIIIFVTAYQEYAMKAWELHVDGYLLKPASSDDISRVMARIYDKRNTVKAGEPKLKVQCFGKFEVFSAGKPVKFARKRAKEVLAYLICARGAGVSTGELCGILWEDSTDLARKKTYLRQYVQSLREALDRCGAGDALIHNRDSYSVDPSLIECDYYGYLRGDRGDLNGFFGEFMSQYPWSEMILAELEAMK